MAPVVVLDREGQFVSGLTPDQFRLFDNGKEQNIHVDVTYIQISLVIAIQANSRVDKMPPRGRAPRSRSAKRRTRWLKPTALSRTINGK